MKTTIENTKSFSPVSITLTAENKVELDKLGSFFNTHRIANSLEFVGADPRVAYRALQKAGANISIYVSEITDIAEGKEFNPRHPAFQSALLGSSLSYRPGGEGNTKRFPSGC